MLLIKKARTGSTMISGSLAGAVLLSVTAMAILQQLPGAYAATDPPQTSAPGEGEKLAHGSDCFFCHAVDHTLVGPAFDAIAQRYRGDAHIAPKLEAKVKAGGSGNWGALAMTPHPNLTEQHLAAIVNWVLSLKGLPPAHGHAAAKTYHYSLPDGSKVALDFQLFSKADQVTNDVFSGWEQFNSYCFRCHGEDASGGAYAPDLRHSLSSGMTRQQFISISMTGKQAKGMPSWAGFFTPKEIAQIYEYVKGRSVGLVPAGRPESSTG